MIDSHCTAGYAIALHISFTTPRFLFQTYNKDWMDVYSENGLVLKDPTVLWGFSNTGVKRWNDLKEMDVNQVLPLARKYGLKYGFTFAIHQDDSRSIGSFARTDRDFSDQEIESLAAIATDLHAHTEKIKKLSNEELTQLKTLSVNYTRG